MLESNDADVRKGSQPETSDAARGEASQPDQPPSQDPLTGDSILNIIDDVEAQLNRLRTAQTDQDDHLATLDSRSRDLEAAERALADRSRVLDRRESAIESLENELAERKRELGSRESAIGERDRLSRQQHEEVEHARAEFKKWQQEIDRARQELERGRTASEAQRKELEAERRRIEDAAQAEGARSQQYEPELAAARAGLEQAGREVAHAFADRDREDEVRKNLEQRVQRAEANVGELIEKLETAQGSLEHTQAEHDGLNNRAADLELELGEVRRELAASQTSLRDKTAQLRAITERATKLSEQVESLVSQAESHAETSTALQNRVTSLEAQARSRQADISALRESHDRATALAEELRGEHAAAQRKLAEARHDGERELGRAAIRLEAAEEELRGMRELARQSRDGAEAAQAQLQALRNELDAARNAAQASDAAAQSLEHRLRERDVTIKRQEETLRSAKGKLSKFAEAIGEQAEQIQRGADAIAALREQKRQMEGLKEQLAAAMLAGNPEELTRRDERIKELTDALRQARGQALGGGEVAGGGERVQTLQNDVDTLKTELERARIELNEARGLAERRVVESQPRNEDEIAALQARIHELEAQLAAAATQPAHGGQAAAAADLKQKAARVRQVAEHLRRRKERLARVKALVEERANSATSADSRDNAPERKATHEEIERQMQLAARIQRDREVLNEAARCLAASEKAMIRRWARPRAIVTLGCAMIVLTFAAGASWFLANTFYPATRTASLRVIPETRPGTAFTDQQAAAWQDWHAGLPEDANFVRTLAARFEERQIAELADPDLLDDLLETSLTVDVSTPKEIVFTMSGNDEDRLMQVLDTMGATIVTESRRQVGRRSDGAEATIAGERHEHGQIVYATMNPTPIEDERLVRALYIFLGILGGLFALMVIVWAGLSRREGVFQSGEYDAGKD